MHPLLNWLFFLLVIGFSSSVCFQAIAHSGWQEDQAKPAPDPFATLKTYHRREKPYDPSKLKHSDRVPALPPELAPGEVLDYRTITSNLPVYGWYPVPDWLAGTWESQHQTRTYFFSNQSKVKKTSPEGQNIPLTLSIGCQKDQLGGIWHYLGVPSRSLGSSKSELTLLWDQKTEPVLINTQSVVTRNLSTMVRVKRKTRRIISTECEETIAHLGLSGDGRLKVVASVKSFGLYGQPLSEVKTFRLMNKASHFKAVNKYKNQDLTSLFQSFLKERSLQHLIPGAPKNSIQN